MERVNTPAIRRNTAADEDCTERAGPSGHGVGARPVTGHSTEKGEYLERNIIERVVGWSRECRRLLSRFEKLAVNYIAFSIIACLVRLL